SRDACGVRYVFCGSTQGTHGAQSTNWKTDQDRSQESCQIYSRSRIEVCRKQEKVASFVNLKGSAACPLFSSPPRFPAFHPLRESPTPDCGFRNNPVV